MTSLFTYMQDVQRVIRDQNQELLNPGDIVAYINRARRDVAMRSECLRMFASASAGVTTITVANGGTGYSSSPAVVVSAPDAPGGGAEAPWGAQATASAVVMGGVIVGIDVTYGGSGYFQPTVTIVDPTGIGATAIAATSPISTLNPGQERYLFSDINVSNWPGYGPVYAVRGCSLIYANYRYSLPQYPFTTYQSMIRQFPNQYYYVPTMCSQFGQGTAGSLYFYPLPSQKYALELDCQCWPQDLLTDQDVEAIPEPWTQAVLWLALSYCYMELQNLNASEYYRKMAEVALPRHRNAANLGRSPNPYGRW